MTDSMYDRPLQTRADTRLCTQPPPAPPSPADMQRLVHELNSLQEQEQRMLYTVAHDLRVPATIIKGYLPFLLDLVPEENMTEQGRNIVAAMQRALRRMEMMVDDLSEATYLQSGELDLKIEPIHLQPYLREKLEEYAGILDITRLIMEIPPLLPAVMADPDRLERILLNLLLNAQKYSDPPTPVTLSALQQGGEVVLSIRDRGRGIPAEALPHLFELFYRAEKGRDAHGLGLGLYTTKKLVEAHGGHIEMESVIGVGSTVTFTLPAVGASDQSSVASSR